MQKLYRVKSKYHLPEARVDFEYNWFVYQRNSNNYQREQSFSGKTQAVTANLAPHVVAELFTFNEACQLQAMLELVFAPRAATMEFTTWLEELNETCNLEEICSLKETYQIGGKFVDPYDFASRESNTLGFLVAARVTNEMRYVAEDFLQNLSPKRLATLRQMHAENDG